jgi:hypothetical protein
MKRQTFGRVVTRKGIGRIYLHVMKVEEKHRNRPPSIVALTLKPGV